MITPSVSAQGSVRSRVVWPSILTGDDTTTPRASKSIGGQDPPEEPTKSTHDDYREQMARLRYQMEQMQTPSQPAQSANPSQVVELVYPAQSAHSAQSAQSKLPAQPSVHNRHAQSTLHSAPGTASSSRKTQRP
jgi:hypothetical protein